MRLLPEKKQIPALLARYGLPVALCMLGGCYMVSMPSRSHTGTLPAFTLDEQRLAERLHRHVVELAATIGERNTERYAELRAAEEYIAANLREAGYTARREEFDAAGKRVANVVAELLGTTRPQEVVVIGAHYDSVPGCPGANDNGSGVAALLELARQFRGMKPARTLRFVAFVNEEPPFFQTAQMGSRVHAVRARQRGDNIVAMLSLETIGCYADMPGSQHYPPPFSLLYPDTGNFIAFVGDLSSRVLVRSSIRTFRETTTFPSEGLAAPRFVKGIGWSDQWAFWQEGYPGIMVTDTAPFRYPHYHETTDTPDKIDYPRMARVVTGLHRVVEELSR